MMGEKWNTLSEAKKTDMPVFSKMMWQEWNALPEGIARGEKERWCKKHMQRVKKTEGAKNTSQNSSAKPVLTVTQQSTSTPTTNEYDDTWSLNLRDLPSVVLYSNFWNITQS